MRIRALPVLAVLLGAMPVYADGMLDPSFGNGGLVITDFGPFTQDVVSSLVILPDGRAVAAGSMQPNLVYVLMSAARYLPSGALDTTFGDGGRVTVGFPGVDFAAFARAVVLQTDGRLILLGSYGAAFTGGSARGVIVIQEWWGLNDHVKDVADRFARAGFTALAPDLYHGKVTKSPDEAGKLLMALNIGQAEKDLRGAVAYLRGLTGKPVGVVGFCMGGALSLFAACTNGPDVGACVIYYGGHPKVQYDFDRLAAPVLGHWAERDDFANPQADKIEAALKARGRSCEFHRYPGTQHAFFNDQRPEVYDEKAAQQSWERTVAFFNAHL